MNRFVSVLRSHPRLFFVGCIVAGAAVARLPFLYESNGNLAVLPYLATWTLTGLIAGYLAPDRPWRWGLAMVFPLPILNTVLAPNPSEMLLLQVVTLPLLPLMAVPIIVGAYCGRSLSSARKSPPMRPAPDPQSASRPSASRQAKLFFLSYLLCTAPALFMPSGTGSILLTTWAVVAAASSAFFVSVFQLRPIRATALAVASAIAAFVTSVIRDFVVGGPSHNLLPFELWIVVIVTILTAGVSAALTS